MGADVFLKTNRFFCNLILIIGIILLLSGCDSGTDTYHKDNKIEYLSMWNKTEPQAQYLQQMAQDYFKETGTEVNISFLGRDVLSKARSRLMTGNPPDIVEQDFNELSAAVSIGSLEASEISDLFYAESGPEGQKRLIDIFGEDLVKLYSKHNKLYFFPYERFTSGFFYNKNLYSKYDLIQPSNWGEFISNCNILNSKEIKPLAADGTISFYNAYYFSWAVERVLGTGAFLRAAEDKSGQAWDDEGYLRAARIVYELSKAQRNYFQKGYQNYLWPTAQIEWAQGSSANILCATWIPSETQDFTNNDFTYGFFPFPEIEGGKGKLTDVEVSFIGCSIPVGANHEREAKEFLKYLVKKENAQSFNKMTKTISARIDVDYPDVLSDIKKYSDNMIVPYRIFDGVWADIPDWLTQVFFPLHDKLFFGNITPEEFVKLIKQASKSFWTKK